MKIQIKLKYFFLTTLILIILTMAINYVIDPMQHYRKANFYKVYTFNQRYLVWGLLDNYSYDSVLLGTSMTENFKTNEFNNQLNINMLRAPLPGASAYEENLLIQKSLENKELKEVFLGLDFFSFRGDKKRIQYGKNSLPTYLMNDNIFDDYKYLLNIDILF